MIGDFERHRRHRGFYIQDPTGDGDAATSDGIFVFTNNANTVSAGDVVRVSGFARERFNQTAITGGATPPQHPCRSRPGTSSICGEADTVRARSTSRCRSTNLTPPSATRACSSRSRRTLVISEYFNYDQFGEIVLALPLDGEERPFTATAHRRAG